MNPLDQHVSMTRRTALAGLASLPALVALRPHSVKANVPNVKHNGVVLLYVHFEELAKYGFEDAGLMTPNNMRAYNKWAMDRGYLGAFPDGEQGVTGGHGGLDLILIGHDKGTPWIEETAGQGFDTTPLKACERADQVAKDRDAIAGYFTGEMSYDGKTTRALYILFKPQHVGIVYIPFSATSTVYATGIRAAREHCDVIRNANRYVSKPGEGKPTHRFVLPLVRELLGNEWHWKSVYFK